jgi:hypothetical protein
MFIFVVPTLQKKWNEIRMKELAGGKCMENNCFLRTLKFEMLRLILGNDEVLGSIPVGEN